MGNSWRAIVKRLVIIIIIIIIFTIIIIIIIIIVVIIIVIIIIVVVVKPAQDQIQWRQSKIYVQLLKNQCLKKVGMKTRSSPTK